MRYGNFPKFGILAIVLWLTGCATPAQHLTEQDVSGIRTIAVVSLVPEQVNFDKVGIISLSNKYTEFDMGGKVTEGIEYVARERIAKVHPDWNVKHVNYDQSALLAKVVSGYGYGSSQVRRTFAELARDNGLDAIVVVRAAADPQISAEKQTGEYLLREGLAVVIKDNNISDEPRIVLLANLNVVMIGKNGEVMAAGGVPAQLDNVEPLRPAEYDVGNDMQHNHRPEVLQKLGREVIIDLSRRMNDCFDALGFVGKADAASYHAEIVPPPAVEHDAKGAGSAPPVVDGFDQCFSRCRQYTDRTKEQCFDVCNK
jgi:hypothetical protein